MAIVVLPTSHWYVVRVCRCGSASPCLRADGAPCVPSHALRPLLHWFGRPPQLHSVENVPGRWRGEGGEGDGDEEGEGEGDGDEEGEGEGEGDEEGEGEGEGGEEGGGEEEGEGEV